MLMIAGHLDSEVPPTRVVCVALDQLLAVVVESRLVMDIESIKWCHPEQPSEPGNELKLGENEQQKLQPMIFVRYAVTYSVDESHLVDREAIDHSANELSDQGISQKRILCSLDEIQHVVSLLQEQEECVDEAYRTKWKGKSALNGTVFRLSLLRPTLEPLFPYRTAQLKRRAERQARENKLIKQRARQQRRIERVLKLQLEELMRQDELQLRRERDEIIDKVCCKPGCEEWALLQCPRCPNACYCRLSRKSINNILISLYNDVQMSFLLSTDTASCLSTADQRQDWLQLHKEGCLSEEYACCALSSCGVHVLIGYSDPSHPFQVNEEIVLCNRQRMDAMSGSVAPVLRYFCSQAHCDEGKEDHEVTLKEYNFWQARKARKRKGKRNTGNSGSCQGRASCCSRGGSKI